MRAVLEKNSFALSGWRVMSELLADDARLAAAGMVVGGGVAASS